MGQWDKQYFMLRYQWNAVVAVTILLVSGLCGCSQHIQQPPPPPHLPVQSDPADYADLLDAIHGFILAVEELVLGVQ